MRSHIRRAAVTGNEYPLLVDPIFGPWYETSSERTVPTSSLQDSITPSPIAEGAVDVGVAPVDTSLDYVFHIGDPVPAEVEELKRLGITDERIAEMSGRYSPQRIAKVLGVTVSQVCIAAAWNRRTALLPAVAICVHCGTSHSPRLQSLDQRPVCSEVCQIELNAQLEAANRRHPEQLPRATIISGSLNADTIRELLAPPQNRLPLKEAAVAFQDATAQM